MAAPQPVLSYATRRPSRAGLAPATLMTIFAATHFLARVGPWTRVLYLVYGPSRIPLPPAVLPLIVEELTQAGLAALAAILLRTRLNSARWLAFWILVCGILGMQLLNEVAPVVGLPFVDVDLWNKLSAGGKAINLAVNLLATVSTCALFCVLWTLAKAADKRLAPAEIPWYRVGRALNLCILATGVCSLLPQTLGIVRRSLAPGYRPDADTLVSWLAAAALVLAATSALMKRRWARLFCTAALALWWLQPLIFMLVRMSSAQLAMVWSQRKWEPFVSLLRAAPLPLLLILLVLHPCIRRASQEADVSPAG